MKSKALILTAAFAIISIISTPSLSKESKSLPQNQEANQLIIKGAFPGMAKSNFDDIYPSLCAPNESESTFFKCVVLESMAPKELKTVGGSPLIYWEFYFYNDKLGMIKALTLSHLFHPTKLALIEKYGRPTRINSSVVSNRMGAKFRQEDVIWKSGARTLTHSQYSSSFEYSAITLVADWFPSAMANSEKYKSKQMAKDL